ncbi:hypothetical protein LTR60_003666, partial [Cryomyces antarcticus]
WNSWWKEIHVAIKLQRHIRSYIDDHYKELKADWLNREQWEELKEIHDFLQAFYDITIDTQGDCSSMDQILTSMDFLVQHYNDAKIKYKDDVNVLSRIISSWYKFDKYYKLADRAPVYTAAVLLHPALRRKTLESQWASQESYIQPAVKEVKELWVREYKPQTSQLAQDDEAEMSQYRLFKKKLYDNAIEFKEEFDHFISQTPTPIGNKTALAWWLSDARRS